MTSQSFSANVDHRCYFNLVYGEYSGSHGRRRFFGKGGLLLEAGSSVNLIDCSPGAWEGTPLQRRKRKLHIKGPVTVLRPKAS